MHKHYIINNTVEFHPATGTLRAVKKPEQRVVLNSPAGRCFLLLIERVGTIVTQEECMNTVWRCRGMMVSHNTYYQNISILRRGLKSVGLGTDLIVTVPRIGLTLASDTKIIIKERSTTPSNKIIKTSILYDKIAEFPFKIPNLFVRGILLMLLLLALFFIASPSLLHKN